jgi:hypothetical protein
MSMILTSPQVSFHTHLEYIVLIVAYMSLIACICIKYAITLLHINCRHLKHAITEATPFQLNSDSDSY